MAVRAKNRGLVYLRRSSGRQELSLASQLTWAIETAAQEGVGMDASLADLEHMRRIGLTSYKDIRLDDSVSGADMQRPGFKAVQKDIAHDRHLSHLFIYMRDRFGRPQDAMPMAMIEKSIREAGVTIVLVNGIAGPLVAGNGDLGEELKILIEYYMSGDFLRKLGERIVNAGTSIASRGFWNGGQAPYGCIRVFVNEAGEVIQELPPGRTIRQEGCHVQLRIKDSVKIGWWILMLDLARAGWGARRIANLLNELSVPSPDAGKVRTVRGVKRVNDGKWNPRTVLDLLRNPAITGELRYGRRSMGAHRRIGAKGPRPLDDGDRTESGSLRVIENDPSLQIRRPGGYEAGYDKGAWEEVQQQLEERGRIQKGIPRVSDLGKYPLSCRILDMTNGCGGLLYARANGQRRIYVCGRYVKGGPKACDNNAVDAEALLALVLQFFQRFMGPELEERLRERWSARQANAPASIDLMPARELAALEKDRQRLQQEQEVLVQNLLQLTSADLIKRLEAKHTDLVRELAEVETKIGVLERAEAPVPMSADEEIESAATLMRNFGAVLDDPQARGALPSFFEKLDLRIGLNFKEGRKGPKRTVRVLQGGVLALAGGKLPIDLHGRDRVDSHTCDAGSEIVTPAPAVLAENGDIVSADGQILSLQGRERRQDKKEAGDDESSPANESRMDLRPNEGVSSTMLSRGDRI